MKRFLGGLLVFCMVLGLLVTLPVSAVAATANTTLLANSFGATFAIKADGTLWTWGSNSEGQLGIGAANDTRAPVKIMDNVRSITSYERSIFAIKTDGSLWAWGENRFGRLGIGATNNGYSPVKVLDNVVSFHCEGSNTFAITSDNSLWIWGSNGSG